MSVALAVLLTGLVTGAIVIKSRGLSLGQVLAVTMGVLFTGIVLLLFPGVPAREVLLGILPGIWVAGLLFTRPDHA